MKFKELENKSITMFRLGARGRDKVTGYEGILTGYCIHLYGCGRYAINPGKDKDGKLHEVVWFDEGRIEVIDEGIHASDVRATKDGADTPPSGR